MTSSLEDDETPLRQARAYNNSILLMLAMPYVLLAGLGLLFYRAYSKASANPLPQQSELPLTGQ